MTNDVKTPLIDTTKRRHDLIPNLVSVVKGYMEYERETLERVTSARVIALSAAGIHAKAAAENILTQALHGLFAVIENYPVLKSKRMYCISRRNSHQLENKIAFSRQLYNDLVANLAKMEYFRTQSSPLSLPKICFTRRN
jgi:LemA protein